MQIPFSFKHPQYNAKVTKLLYISSLKYLIIGFLILIFYYFKLFYGFYCYLEFKNYGNTSIIRVKIKKNE